MKTRWGWIIVILLLFGGVSEAKTEKSKKSQAQPTQEKDYSYLWKARASDMSLIYSKLKQTTDPIIQDILEANRFSKVIPWETVEQKLEYQNLSPDDMLNANSSYVTNVYNPLYSTGNKILAVLKKELSTGSMVGAPIDSVIEATQNFLKANFLMPDYGPEINYKIGYCYYLLLKNDNALFYLQKELQYSGADCAHELMADIYFEQENYAEVVNKISKDLSFLNCKDPFPFLSPLKRKRSAFERHNWMLAVSYDQIGEYEKARDYYREYLSLVPDDPDALLNLGNMNSNLKFFTIAADCYYRAALQYLKQGNRDGAVLAYNNLKTLPNEEKLQQRLFNRLYPPEKGQNKGRKKP